MNVPHSCHDANHEQRVDGGGPTDGRWPDPKHRHDSEHYESLLTSKNPMTPTEASAWPSDTGEGPRCVA